MISESFKDPLRLGQGQRTRHNAIDECIAEHHAVVQPAVEPRIELPTRGKLTHEVPEYVAVVLDQLTRQNDQATTRVVRERRGARGEKARELRREGPGWRRIEGVGIVQRDPDFGRVRDYELDPR